MLEQLAHDAGCEPNGEIVEDEVPEPPDEAITRLGDLIILGDHRLLCGDSSKPEDLDRLLGGAKIHLVNTDPPYNVKVEPRSNNAIAAGLSSFAGTKHQQSLDLARHPEKSKPTNKKMRAKDRPLANDFVTDEAFDQLLDAWFGNAARVLQPGRSFYVWGGYANLGNYPPFLKKHGLYFSQGIVWGDGSAPQAATLVQGVGGGTVAASYAYAAGGIYTVTVTVTDDDTGEATQTTMSVVVGAGIQNGVLQIVGTSGDDLLNIYRTGTGLVKVHASFFPEGQRDYSEAEVELIHVWLLDGNDHATLAGNVDLPVVMDGGGGNDTLNSTEGPAILLGGIGNDELSGGQGRSILIGGIGQDRIVGGSGENVIIGGTTAYDGNDVALLMLLAEWTSSRSFALRVENLKAGAGPVLGGSGIRLEQDATVLDDSDFDLLTGSAGIDWFLFDDDEDDVTDLKSNEEGS